MQVTFIAEADTGAGDNKTVNKPTGTLRGHLVVIVANYFNTKVGSDPTNLVTCTPPAGFVSALKSQAVFITGVGNNHDQISTEVFWKIAGASEPSTYTVVVSNDDTAAPAYTELAAFAYSGVDQTIPIGPTSVATFGIGAAGAAYTATWTGVTSTRNGSMALAVLGGWAADGTTPVGYTARANGIDGVLDVSELAVNAGATGSPTSTVGASATSQDNGANALFLVLNGASSPAVYVPQEASAARNPNKSPPIAAFAPIGTLIVAAGLSSIGYGTVAPLPPPPRSANPPALQPSAPIGTGTFRLPSYPQGMVSPQGTAAKQLNAQPAPTDPIGTLSIGLASLGWAQVDGTAPRSRNLMIGADFAWPLSPLSPASLSTIGWIACDPPPRRATAAIRDNATQQPTNALTPFVSASTGWFPADYRTPTLVSRRVEPSAPTGPLAPFVSLSTGWMGFIPVPFDAPLAPPRVAESGPVGTLLTPASLTSVGWLSAELPQRAPKPFATVLASEPVGAPYVALGAPFSTVGLYLTDTSTGSPYPTTSRTLSTTANASQVQLGPGRFSTALPGNTRAGQYNPSSPIANNTNSAEIDNTGSSEGTTRQGWLWDQDLTGLTIPSGAWTAQLRNIELQAGTTSQGRFQMRASVITAVGGVWTTVAELLTTSISGESSHSAGQTGWTSCDATINCATTAFNRATSFVTSSAPHTFAAGERLLIEIGFGTAGSAAARTWGLQYNDNNSLVTFPRPLATNPSFGWPASEVPEPRRSVASRVVETSAPVGSLLTATLASLGWNAAPQDRPPLVVTGRPEASVPVGTPFAIALPSNGWLATDNPRTPLRLGRSFPTDPVGSLLVPAALPNLTWLVTENPRTPSVTHGSVPVDPVGTAFPFLARLGPFWFLDQGPRAPSSPPASRPSAPVGALFSTLSSVGWFVQPETRRAATSAPAFAPSDPLGALQFGGSPWADITISPARVAAGRQQEASAPVGSLLTQGLSSLGWLVPESVAPRLIALRVYATEPIGAFIPPPGPSASVAWMSVMGLPPRAQVFSPMAVEIAPVSSYAVAHVPTTGPALGNWRTYTLPIRGTWRSNG